MITLCRSATKPHVRLVVARGVRGPGSCTGAAGHLRPDQLPPGAGTAGPPRLQPQEGLPNLLLLAYRKCRVIPSFSAENQNLAVYCRVLPIGLCGMSWRTVAPSTPPTPPTSTAPPWESGSGAPAALAADDVARRPPHHQKPLTRAVAGLQVRLLNVPASNV